MRTLLAVAAAMLLVPAVPASVAVASSDTVAVSAKKRCPKGPKGKRCRAKTKKPRSVAIG